MITITLFNIDNEKFYAMRGTQKAVNMARYIRKNKIVAMDEKTKNAYIQEQSKKNKGLILNEIVTKVV